MTRQEVGRNKKLWPPSTLSQHRSHTSAAKFVPHRSQISPPLSTPFTRLCTAAVQPCPPPYHTSGRGLGASPLQHRLHIYAQPNPPSYLTSPTPLHFVHTSAHSTGTKTSCVPHVFPLPEVGSPHPYPHIVHTLAHSLFFPSYPSPHPSPHRPTPAPLFSPTLPLTPFTHLRTDAVMPSSRSMGNAKQPPVSTSVLNSSW